MAEPALSSSESIGRVIAELRKERGWSQAQLAERSGVSQQTIGEIETRGGGRFETVRRLAKALRVPLARLDKLLPPVQINRNSG